MSQCPLCQHKAAPWSTIRDYEIDECGSCKHRFVNANLKPSHVDEVYSDEYFVDGGAGYANYLEQAKLLEGRGRYFANIVYRATSNRGLVLDVGAAAGFLLKGWQNSDWECIGVEPNQFMCDVARQNGFDVRCSSFEDLKSVEPESVDCVSIIQVISHFIDPLLALRKAFEFVRPGGSLIIETWNRASWAARFAGQVWHEYSPPSVLHWFTPETLLSAASRVGFEVVKFRRSQRWVNVGHARSLLEHAGKNSRLSFVAGHMLRLLPNSLDLPYPGDDLFWALFRKPYGIQKA